MTFRKPITVVLVAALTALLAAPALRADDDRGDDDRSRGDRADDDRAAEIHTERSRAAKRRDRADNDVRVQLKVRGKRGADLRVRLTVKNRGQLEQSDLEVILHDGDPQNPLFREVISLSPGKRQKFRLKLDPDDVGDVLTASCYGAHEEDDRPDDNEVSETITSGTPTDASAAARGRSIYVPLCSGCHGADGRGGSVDENIAREPWHEFVEAFAKGEDGMPLFPNLNSRDARDIVAYLRDPSAVTPPPTTPPTTPPPAGTSPTYKQNVKRVLDSQCAACHGKRSPAGGITLSSYSSSSRNASAALAAITARRMPPNGSVSTIDQQTIRDWITGGKRK